MVMPVAGMGEDRLLDAIMTRNLSPVAGYGYLFKTIINNSKLILN